MKKDLLCILDLSQEEILHLLEWTLKLKDLQKRGIPHRPLVGKSLGLLFEKPSTRTRVSFQAGMYQLGGEVIFMSPSELQIGRGETISDTARVLSRYLDIIALRTYRHETIEEFATHASIPVINALSDRFHPCQVLADLVTIQEALGNWRGIKVAFVGDGNNVAASWANLAARVGIEVVLATPKGYELPKEVMEAARREGAKVKMASEVQEAVKGAQVVYTDVWVSMGQDKEREERLRAFAPYQVTPQLMEMADSGAIFMHCLPAHRGEEVVNEVIDGPRSVVWDQAENRLHLQKALMLMLLEQI
ncbi:MAG TPA: ornithine carbamoyltransferase [Thermosulfidibacter takaii]|uniref:Ornithine carbamoyltransferase n=1 Tax=Thermosulfidibacter takaii TaxID=412593 RepID=A0A7C0Y8Z2_9BACT|nr:ornithine carbamoyltransferase [Thermosulfidibacter takaii]